MSYSIPSLETSFAGITWYFPGGQVTDCVNWLRTLATTAKGTSPRRTTTKEGDFAATKKWLVAAFAGGSNGPGERTMYFATMRNIQLDVERR